MSDLPNRLLAEAQRFQPPMAARTRLMPFREAILTFLAKGVSHQKIADVLKQHGIQIERSAVGHFCRHHCPRAEIQRVRVGLTMPVPTSHFASPSVLKTPSVSVSTGVRRSPRIARDDL